MTVIAYHAVGDCPRDHDPHGLVVSVDDFTRQLDFLATRRRVVSLADLVAGRVDDDRPPVAVTFDDGYRSVLETAAPLLRERDMPATVFVPTGWLGRRNGWDDVPLGPFEILAPDELPAVEALGVSVESHGHDHISYVTSSVDAVERDLEASTAALTQLVRRRPSFLAYPYGPSSPVARDIVARHGFTAAFSIDAPHEGDYAFGRVAIQPGDGMPLFQWKTAGHYLAVRHHPLVRSLRGVIRPVRARLRR